MIKKFELYIERLTVRNWGAPYHLILSNFATAILFGLGAGLVASFLIVFFIGIAYEIYQIGTADRSVYVDFKRNVVEDIVFDFLGCASAVLTLLIV